MAHIPHKELQKLLDEAGQKIEVGATYYHYKHPIDQPYTVLNLAILEATEEPAVIYKAQYEGEITFIRPISEWLDMVEWEGKQVPRFQKK
ncbi:MAG TPA: DUF1653 domain-containing protein [Candidatus Paceibacterota bacterium]